MWLFITFIRIFLPFPSLQIIFVYKQVICQALKDIWSDSLAGQKKQHFIWFLLFHSTRHFSYVLGSDCGSHCHYLLTKGYLFMVYETQTCVTTWSQAYCTFPRTRFPAYVSSFPRRLPGKRWNDLPRGQPVSIKPHNNIPIFFLKASFLWKFLVNWIRNLGKCDYKAWLICTFTLSQKTSQWRVETNSKCIEPQR